MRSLRSDSEGDEDAALKDLEEANRLVPGDAAVMKELAQVRE